MAQPLSGLALYQQGAAAQDAETDRELNRRLRIRADDRAERQLANLASYQRETLASNERRASTLADVQRQQAQARMSGVRPVTVADPDDPNKGIVIDANSGRRIGGAPPPKGMEAGVVAGDFSKTGEEFLKTLKPEEQGLIKKVAAYEIDPKTMSTKGGHRERILSQAAQYDPKFDQKEYNTIYNAITRFATGPQGNTVRSLNVAIEHMDTARQLAKALKNQDLQAINFIGNEFARQTGSARPTNFESARDVVANEVLKGTIGGAGALEDRQKFAAALKTAASPAQFAGTLDTWSELLGGQLKGLEQQYEGATRRKDFRQRYVTPRALEAISAATKTPEGGGGKSVKRTGTLPDGRKVVEFSDGTVETR